MILLAYRMGQVRHEEQLQAMLAAAQVATDAMSYLTALENFGIVRHSALYALVGKLLAAPNYYRNLYANMLGLHKEGEVRASFLNNNQVLFLVEPVLTHKQQALFYDTYWWFSHNHQPIFNDTKKGATIGLYATEPKDNASTLERFEEYLNHLVNHKTQRIRERYEGFPTEIVLAILQRAFL